MSSFIMDSLYLQLEQQKDTDTELLPERKYYKSSLVGLSHAVEDVVKKLNLAAIMFVTFQRFEFFLQELERYRELSKICKKVYIFCHGIDENYIKDIPEFSNVEFIELSLQDSLVQEWHIVVYHPEYPMMFVAREVDSISDGLTDAFDEFRTFKGFFDFTPEMVRTAVEFFYNKINSTKDIEEDIEISSNTMTSESIEFLNSFINNSLLLLEERNHQLIETTREYTKFKTDMDNMEKVHNKFLPKTDPNLCGLDVSAEYIPAEQVGSDFYQYITFRNKFIFYITDVTGHGFDGALINIFIRENIKNCLFSFQSENNITAKAIMNKLSETYVDEQFPDDQFACVMVGVIDLDDFEITISNAGIEVPPYLNRQGGDGMEIPVSGIPLTNAVDKELLIYEQDKFQLQHGDVLLLCSDGINQGVQFANYDFVKQTLNNSKRLTSDEILRKITEKIVGEENLSNLEIELDDDMTLIIIKRCSEGFEEG